MPTLHIASLKVQQGGFRLQIEDWRANGGEVVLLAGPNGSGKTTFQEAAMGVRRAEVRTLAWNGQPRERLVPLSAYVPTNHAFFPSAQPNQLVPLFRAMYPTWSEEAFSRWASEWKLSLRRPLKTLSMGEKRRFFLALGLATRASILVLDEPLTNVDPEMAYVLADGFVRLAREEGLLIWVSTNFLEPFLGRFDRADFLKEGLLVHRMGGEEAAQTMPRDLWRRIYP
jgi:ABC-2 type transport system ATP-binding protein